MKALSIVIPNYNNGKYLKRCLNSIYTNKSLDDFEVIIVDDGSTDDSRTIISECTHSFPNIKSILQENRGVSAARNTGLQLAKSPYVTFCDPDDCLEPHLLDNLLPNIYKYDWIIYGRKDYDGSGTKLINNCNAHNTVKEHYNSRQYMHDVFSNGICTFSSCNKIYKMDIIRTNHILFNEVIKYSEDTLFNLQYGFKVETILEDFRFSYIRYCNAGSTMYSHIPNFFIKNMKTIDSWKASANKQDFELVINNLATHYAKVASRRLLYGIDATEKEDTKKGLLEIINYFRHFQYIYIPDSSAKERIFAFLFNHNMINSIYTIFGTIRGLTARSKK